MLLLLHPAAVLEPSSYDSRLFISPRKNSGFYIYAPFVLLYVSFWHYSYFSFQPLHKAENLPAFCESCTRKINIYYPVQAYGKNSFLYQLLLVYHYIFYSYRILYCNYTNITIRK